MSRLALLVAPTVALGALLCACPGGRDSGGGAPATSTVSSTAAVPSPPTVPAASVLASATVAPVDEKIVPLFAGEALPTDGMGDGEVYGVELLFELRHRNVPSPPLHLGATVAAVTAAQNSAVGVLRITVGAGRFRTRFGPRAFAMDDGWELRADRRRGGAIVLFTHGGAPIYRVVPTGALRPLLAERRIDVVPLGPTHLASAADPPPHLGRPVTRVRVTTAWGSIELDQISAPTSSKPVSSKLDARSDADGEQQGLDGAGEALCRSLLELIAADRAASGPPCSIGLLPVRAEVSFTHGGGMSITATSLREGPIARADLAFPPAAAHTSPAALGEPKLPLASSETLFAMRSKGESASFDLVDKTPAPRIALIDGVPAYLVPSAGDARVTLRAGRYVIEWRTALGELVERALEIDVPGRATVSQWVPAPLSSASPIASARNGP